MLRCISQQVEQRVHHTAQHWPPLKSPIRPCSTLFRGPKSPHRGRGEDEEANLHHTEVTFESLWLLFQYVFNASGLSFADKQTERALQSSAGRLAFQLWHENTRKPTQEFLCGQLTYFCKKEGKKKVRLHRNVFQMSLQHICCSSSPARVIVFSTSHKNQ